MVSNGASTCMKKVPKVGGLIVSDVDNRTDQTICPKETHKIQQSTNLQTDSFQLKKIEIKRLL